MGNRWCPYTAANLENGTRLIQASQKDRRTGTVVDLVSPDRDAGKEAVGRIWVSIRMCVTSYVTCCKWCSATAGSKGGRRWVDNVPLKKAGTKLVMSGR